MADSEEEVRKALEGVLELYDIKLEKPKEGQSADERRGDYAEIINKTQEKLDDLSEKAEEIYKKTGMTRDQLETYAANPNNFTKEQWEALQKVKQACERYKREARAQIPDKDFEQKAETQRKKQPQKFAKKKHWIPL